MANQEEKIEEFVRVTGIDGDRAKFYLESASWNLELAMSSFYEDGDEDMEAEVAPADQASGSSQSGATAPRFATMSSVRTTGEPKEGEGQAFYAGGSETSGQQVLGPPKKKVDPDEVVDNLFQSAKDHGAETVESAEPQRRKPGKMFQGSGYRLGDTEEKSDVIPGARVVQKRQVDMVLKLWKNGFSIDDGPKREYSDQGNKEFLDAVSKGEVPKELIQQARGGEVNLNMEDHRAEDYVKPKVPLKAFTGEGHMLGSPAPNVVSKSSESAAGASSHKPMSVDDSQPSTTLQIRLADGSRMVAKFNHGHQISDVRNYIISCHPQYASSTFVLMTTFPNKELEDESETLEKANLLNAVIVQRLR